MHTRNHFGVTIQWNTQCIFIFQASQTIETFILGCLFTFVLCLLINYLPILRKNIENALFPQINRNTYSDQLTFQQIILKRGILPFMSGFMYSLLFVLIILVLMQLNGYVLIVITAGYTLGFFLFEVLPAQYQECTQCNQYLECPNKCYQPVPVACH